MDNQTIMAKKKGSVELRILIPENLRNQFKGKAATEGRNMSELITAFMRTYLANEITVSTSETGTEDLRIFVPQQLRNQFKGKCSLQGLNMSQVISGFMRDYIAGNISIDMLNFDDDK